MYLLEKQTPEQADYEAGLDQIVIYPLSRVKTGVATRGQPAREILSDALELKWTMKSTFFGPCWHAKTKPGLKKVMQAIREALTQHEEKERSKKRKRRC